MRPTRLASILGALMTFISSAAYAQNSEDQEVPDGTLVPVESEDDAVPQLKLVEGSPAEVLEPAERNHSLWLQGDLAGSFYDARRDVYIGQMSAGLSVGWRFNEVGVYLMGEYDRTSEFTLETDTLHLLNLGVGVELLSFLGRVRSAIAVGTSSLLQSTEVDGAGNTGWFIDARPVALRWPVGDSTTLQLAPITLDVRAPVPDGLPLIMTSYMTVFSVEWSAQ